METKSPKPVIADSVQRGLDHPRMIGPTTLALIALLLVATTALAQERREAMTLNEQGQILQYTGEDDEPTALVTTGNSNQTLLAEGDAVAGTGGGTVDGFGALGDLNDQGIAVLQIAFDDDSGASTDRSDGALAFFNGGTITTVAVSRHDGSGTAFGSDTLCAISPMPLINNAGQIAYHGILDIGGDGNLTQSCGDNNFNGGGPTEGLGGEKSILVRYTPGPGHEVLIEANYVGGADTLTTTAASGYLSGPTTFDITEVDFINTGERKLNSSGTLIAGLSLDNDTSDDATSPGACNGGTANLGCAEDDDRLALVVANGTSVIPIAVAGPPGQSSYQGFDGWGGQSEFQAFLNDGGSVLFKSFSGTEPVRGSQDCGTRDSQCDITEYRIDLYRPGTGVTTLVRTGDTVPTPGSNAIFCDFAPHFSLNDSGNVAFLASLAMDGQCDFQTSGGLVDGSGDWEALFYYSDGTLTEIARNVEAAANDTGAGPFVTSFNGLSFDEIGSVAILPNSGVVYFYGEDFDGEEDFPGCPGDLQSNGPSDDNGELTEIYAWLPNSGIESVLREGDLLPNGDRIVRIATQGPKLRKHANSNGQLVALLETDDAASGDCIFNPDDGDEAVVVTGVSTLPPTLNILEIPVGGPLALGSLMLLLATASLLWLRRIQA